MKDNEDFEPPTQRSRERQTTFGYSSQELYEIEKIIRQLVEVNNLSLSSFVAMMQKHPFMQEQTKLIEQQKNSSYRVFKHTELVQDMIAFLVEPRRMLEKYKLTPEEGLRYIKNIANFIKENRQFYEFLFIALEENTTLFESFNSQNQGEAKREIMDPKKMCLDQWFNFLDDKTIHKDQRRTSLGYIYEIFLPFIKYEFSSSSRINDYYQNRYKQDITICLIFHFHKKLIQKLIRHTQDQTIFKCLFKLVLVSLQEQQWKYSLALLNDLCESAVIIRVNNENQYESVERLLQTSDSHIENIYNMVKQVSDNITNDKNRTVFAFLSAIIKSKIIKGAINRLNRFYEERQKFINMPQLDFQYTIELNIKTGVQVVKIYYLLLKSKINKNAALMNQLRSVIISINKSVQDLLCLVKNNKVNNISFSNGEIFRATSLYKYEFFNLIKLLLQVEQDHGELDSEMRMDKYYSELIALIQVNLSENRWNSIIHSLFQKILGMIITTQFFKSKDTNLNNFLQFLMEAFTNKKYVFLNSTRMTNQGDIQSLYNICRKIAISFEKASLSFGLSNQYEQWRGFVLSVLQGYEKTLQSRTSSIQVDDQPENHESNQAFSVQIDQIATVKQIVQRIETKQIWMNKCSSSKNLFRSGSEQNLLQQPKTCKTIQNFKRQVEYSPNATNKPRVSFHQDKVIRSLISQFKTDRKQSSSTGNLKEDCEHEKKQEELKLSRFLSIEKHSSEIIDQIEEKRLSQVKQFNVQKDPYGLK